MQNTMNTFPGARDTEWVTWSSHPASGTAYQEVEGDENAMNSVMWARVVVDGVEVVSPSTDVDSVYRQYQGRVDRAIESYENE